MKIQPMSELEREMREVAQGTRTSPADAAMTSVESTETLVRLLTPDNRGLLRVIRDMRPESVAELARLTKRAEPNLLRTLGKLEAFGLIEMRMVDRRRVPTTNIGLLHLAIDPYGMSDRVEMSPVL